MVGNKSSSTCNQVTDGSKYEPIKDSLPLNSLSLLEREENLDRVNHVPIVSSYNDRVRPLLDAIDKLRHLMVMKEGIQLPTIVVVGDQSSGKSSVLESLAGINLPRGQGICTRVPLIMRLQHHIAPNPELFLEYHGKIVPTDEDHVADAISLATSEVAGIGKSISNSPLTLVVKKNGVPDLTMIDLPGITRVPVHGQPEDIYEQIAGIIMEYIKPAESIILNVLSATIDFSTCESIRMSRQVDKSGERTLAVVTKADRAPEGLLEKVTADDVNIGLGYVCVRNRIGDETYEEARSEEAKLFSSHPLLSGIDKSMVGISVLAQKLVQIQATIIAKCLPEIFRKINEKLELNVAELNKMPKTLSSSADAMVTFLGIIGSAKESISKLLLRGQYEEYPDDKSMCCSARLAEMVNEFSAELHNFPLSDPKEDFLMEEIRVLNEAKGIALPNYIPRSAFLAILRPKVEKIEKIPADFHRRVWAHIERVVITVLEQHSQSYHQFQVSARRSGRNVIAKMKEEFISWVSEIVLMVKLTDYTCDTGYMDEWNKLIVGRQEFIDNVEAGLSRINVFGLGEVVAKDLKKHEEVLHLAFDLKMRLVAYWKIVLRRLVDYVALRLQLCLHNLVNKEMEKEIINELVGAHGGVIERLLEESPGVAEKRERLKISLKLLKESKEVLANIKDNIASGGD
uniref:Dynamin-related protein 4C-like n=1 Tax=Rhizophora mucronata TaxID=61149 RepID=A0A2P2MFG7_RHIMU